MIDEIEIAISNHKASCVKCGKEILRLEIRGKRNHVKAHPEYICEKCLKKELEEVDNEVNKIKKEFNKFSNMKDSEKEGYLNRLKILRKLEWANKTEILK